MPGDIERVIANLGPCLVSLSLYGGPWKPTSAEWLADLTGLESLSMDTFFLTSRLSPRTFKLQHFTASRDTEDSDFTPVKKVLWSSRTSFVNVHLEWLGLPSSLDLSEFTALREFRLSSDFDSDDRSIAATSRFAEFSKLSSTSKSSPSAR